MVQPSGAALWIGAAAGWLVGTAWQLQSAVLATPAVIGVCLAVGALAGLTLAVLGVQDGAARAAAPERRNAGSAQGRWRVRMVLASLGAALLAHGSVSWRAQLRIDEALAPALESADLLLEGTVASLPVERADGVRFHFEVDRAEQDGRALLLGPQVPRRVQLGWYRGFPGAKALPAVPPELGPGQRWRWVVRLHRPQGQVNPHGFDQELAWFEQGVRAIGHVRPQSPITPVQVGAAQGHWIDRWRHQVRRALAQQVSDRGTAGLLAGLAVGDQSAIEREDWQVFRRTGVAHLLAVSGLHITLFAQVMSALAQAVWRRGRRRLLWCPAPSVGRWAGLAAAWAYALLAGWGVPAQRTVLMLAVLTVLRSGARHWPGPLVLLVCALVVIGFDPWAMLQAGFWLSFVAVALLMLSEPARWRRHAAPDMASATAERAPADPALAAAVATGSLTPVGLLGRLAARMAAWRPAWHRARAQLADASRAAWRSQWIASVGLAPWTLLFFNQISLIGLLANALAIPWVTLVITPLALLGMAWSPLWSVAAHAADVLMAVLNGLSTASWASLSVPAAPRWAQVLAMLGAAWLVLPLPRALRGLGVFWLLPAIGPALGPAWGGALGAASDRPGFGQFDLLGVDIGQGNAVLVRTASHSLLYDTGPLYGRDSNAGDRVLVPLLGALGERRLDRLVLSHRDADHVGGAAAVLREPGAAMVLSSLEAGHPLRALAPHQPCVAGLSWRWDGVDFSVLHPTPRDLERAAAKALKPNGVSCVLRIVQVTPAPHQPRSVLLTGDIERDQEAAILARQAASETPTPGRASDAAITSSLAADVLLVPHHGSRTSSTEAWLAAVRPQWALIQAGHRNRYGHPAPDVVARYEMHAIGVIRTDSCGAWHWRSADALQWCERRAVQRYWHGLPADNGLELAND
ncbi:MAG: ComEC/Rec2 family competence protein [Leptothrix sp. (in: b-proteobacteria)]